MTQIFSINQWAANHAAEKMKSKENQALGRQEQVFQGRRYQYNYLQTALNVVKIATVALVAIAAVLAMKVLFVVALAGALVAYQIQKVVNSMGARAEDRPDDYIGSELHAGDVRAFLGLPHEPQAAKKGEKAPEAWTPTHSILGLPVWHRTAEVGKNAVYERADAELPSNISLGLIVGMKSARDQINEMFDKNRGTDVGDALRAAKDVLDAAIERAKYA
jgi:hypothetical protein